MENSILVLETGGLYNQGLPSWLCQSRQLRTELGNRKHLLTSCEHCSEYVNLCL